MRFSDGLPAAVHRQLAIDVLEVGLDGIDGDIECARNLLVGMTLCQQAEYLQFALTEWLGLG